MRSPWFAPIAATVMFAAAGCPKTPPVNATSGTASAAELRIGKLARILRAEDRRIVDDDLRALLGDADAVIRAKAVLAFGQIGDPATLPALDPVTADGDAGVRANAALAFGLIADASSEAAVERLAGDAAPPVRAAAAEALGRLHAASGGPKILALLDDPDTEVKAAAALAAWKFEDPAPLIGALLADLAAPEPRLRMASSYALARLGSAPVAPASSGAAIGRLSEADVTRVRAALMARVADPDAEVRMHVARGLASPHAGAELASVGALSKDPVTGVRVNAVRSLGYPGEPIKPYLEKAAGDREQSVARAAIEAIGLVGGKQAASVLSDVILKVENGWLREAALTSMAKADPTSTPEIVSGLLSNPDVTMRAAAAALIAGRKEPLAIRAALALLADPAPQIQALAAPIVASQDGPVAILLAGFFKSPDPVVRSAVADVVADRFANPHRGVESFDDLYARLEEIWTASTTDTIPDAKLSVVDAAAKAGKDDRTRAVLTRALGDPDVIVRRRAASQFKDTFNEDKSLSIGPASDRPLADYEKIVRFGLVPHTAVISLQRPGSGVGWFAVALDSDAAPMAAWNFAQLAGKGFFDGDSVHRVVPNFVVQDGDPRGDGNGGPGYSIRDEFNGLAFATGVMGMASSGKDTAGSQWFVTLSPQPHLDGRYTSFGRVVHGFREIVTQIRPGDTVVSIRVYEGNGTAPKPAT
jgi:cyclophilin family peptidyl-prolyl cis-trans isomerase/HEAT repeat protein